MRQAIQTADPLDVALKDFDGAWASLEQEEPELHQQLARVRLELRRLLTGTQPIYGFKRDEIIAALKIEDLRLSLDEIERIRAATAPSLSELFGAVDRIDTTEITRQITNLKAKIERRNAKLESCEGEILKLKSQLKGLGILFGGVDEPLTKAKIDSLSIDVKVLKSEIKLMNIDLHELEQDHKTMKTVSKQIQNSDRRAQSEALANVFVCWLAPFLEILFGTLTGTFSIQYGKLFVHRRKDQHQNIIHAARANIFLDATTTAESISFRTGIPAERILVCEAIHDQGAVVHHIQVKDFGLAGKKRADSNDERIKAAIAGIKNQHEGCNSVEFDHLGKASVTNAQGVHFRDSRGENSFMENDVFIHIGLPMPNIGAVRIDYEILERPGAPSFEAYYQDICDAEVFQEMGRDRALRRMGNIFHYWLTDLELPLVAQTMKAADISIDAASQSDITRASIIKAIATQAKSGGKITQDAIASLANVSQGWISKFFTGIGGWRVWRQIITCLLKGSYKASNNLDSALESLSEDERWIAQEYLSVLVLELEENPLEVTESVAALALGYGASAWARILAAADRNVVAELLGMMLLVTPEWVSVGVREAII